MDFRWDIIVYYFPLLMKGTLLTIGISLASILMGAVLGLGIGFGKMSPKAYIRLPMACYINFFAVRRYMCRSCSFTLGLCPCS